jgi:tripeptide aminopeptidase
VIDRQRVVDEFIALVSTGSVSCKEADVAKRLVATLEAMGATVDVDDAGPKAKSNTGNVLARFPGSADGAPPFLLCAHMDTVVPGEKVSPVVSGDIVRTDGTSVLGGDDKSGIVAILEAVRVVEEQRIPHGPIEVLFTVCEELGLIGAKHFDVSRLTARTGLVLDCDGVQELITRAPAANTFDVTVHGLEAHAGIAPEQGISAIQVAAEAIAGMRLGRVDDETTANLGVVSGGLAINIIPNEMRVRGETRSLSVEKLERQTAHMRERFEQAASRHRVTVGGQERQARVDVRVRRDYERLAIADDARVVKLVRAAAGRVGGGFRTRGTGGGSDANVFSARGLEVANLGCGMRQIHTVDEWIDVRDVFRTAELLVETLRLNAER